MDCHAKDKPILSSRSLALLTLSFVLILLVGCSAGWRAPLDTRYENRPSSRSPAPATAAASPRTASRPPRPGASSYRVQRGDTLYAIAWRSDNDFRDLARWNNIRAPYTIYAGQQLRLKPPQGGPRSASAASTPRPSAGSAADRASASGRPAAAPAARSNTPQSPASAARPAQSGTAPAARPSNGRLAWAWPASGAVTSTFKSGDSLRKGIKLTGSPGDPVRAAETGKVVYSGSGLIGYGRLIIVKHNDKYLSAYGHNRKLLVRQGQQVTKGQKIAEMGKANDGRPLLHFEIRRDGKPVNPSRLLPRR